jgi:hypothetical protein
VRILTAWAVGLSHCCSIRRGLIYEKQQQRETLFPRLYLTLLSVLLLDCTRTAGHQGHIQERIEYQRKEENRACLTGAEINKAS